MAQPNGSAVAGNPPGKETHGQVLTGKQEHCRSFPDLQTNLESGITDETTDLKRELIAQQVKFEITELNSPTALQRFGAPFKSDFGEVSPLDSDLPILRYIFVHHVREFPFLDKAKEEEFWQDKLQVVGLPFLAPDEELLLIWGIVPAILRRKTYLVFGRSTRGDEAEEAVDKMPEVGGADDGFGDPYCVGV
jgi:hypothetical protein